MSKYADLHRHDEHSLFDGFGKPQELSKIAKELGYDALGLTNHGDVGGLVSHYFECKNNDIKPILGCEVYFQPNFKQIRKSFHLCLFVKNLKGYKNLNRIMAKSAKSQFYYKAIVDFDLLEKYKDGLICSSACIGGTLSQFLIEGKDEIAYKVARKFKKIFDDDFYIELQPYKLTEEGLQEKANEKLIELADELDIKCILTSDSHFGRKEHFDTYLKMHEIGGHLEMGKGYSERYMPTQKEIIKRFVKMHQRSLEDPVEFAKDCIDNIQEIVDKVDDEILEKLPQSLPSLDDVEDSVSLLWEHIKKGLKAKGKFNKRYIDRCKEEFDVIKTLGFADYFLIVEDYVKWAKESGIEVGPGRGSVCNCLIAFALDITETDSIYFDLDFRRFLRKDKKKLPDIDIDFEIDKRGLVIDYLTQKYKGHAARICSYGLYKVDNLVNDLAKVCGLPTTGKELDAYQKEENKNVIKNIKTLINRCIDDETGDLNPEKLLSKPEAIEMNERYDNILVHFSRMYKKLRFYGTHAAGVAITGKKLLDYISIMRSGKKEDGTPNYLTVSDLIDIEQIKGVKFDMLGLRTMSIIRELREITNQPHHFNYEWLDDPKIYEQFKVANTDGIFQFEKKGAKNLLKTIEADCCNDLIAASALNRPGPLSLGMVEQYAEAKLGKEQKHKTKEKEIFNTYAPETFGCFVFQEQIMKICVELAGMEWADADKIMKFMKNNKAMTEKALKIYKQEEARLRSLFVEGGHKNKGYDKKVLNNIFDQLMVYAFNKGHAVGYTLISVEQMYYKIYHTMKFWYITLKYAKEEDIPRLSSQAVRDGAIILLPHVNGCAKYSLTKVDGDICIREGLSTIKGVGLKAAEIIESERLENGNYKDYDDFYDRMEQYGRVVNKRVFDALKESGALEFKKKVYFNRVYKYNSSLYARYEK